MVFCRNGHRIILKYCRKDKASILNPYYRIKATPTIIKSAIIPYGTIRM